MLKKKLEIFLEIYNLKYLIFIFLIFGSLNINPGFIFQNEINFNYFLNLTRLIAPFLFYLFFFKKKIYFSNSIFKILLIYIIFAFFSSFTTSRISIFSSNHFYYIIFLVLVLGFNEINKTTSYKKFLSLYNYTFIFIIIVFFAFLINLILTDPNYIFGLRGHPNLFPSERIFDQAIVRSTGLSRFALLIFIFFISLFLYNNSYNLTQILILFILSMVIHSFYSRTSLYFLYLISFPFLFFGFLDFKKSFIYRLNSSIIIFLIPFLIFYNLQTPKIHNNYVDNLLNKLIEKSVDNKNVEEDFVVNTEKKKLKQETLKNNKFIFKKPGQRDVTTMSGRDYFWKKTLELSNKEYLIGGGFQYDRHLFDISISNGFLYSLLSAGLVGIVVYFFLLFKLLSVIFITLIKKKYDAYSFSSITIILYLILRSLVETSFMFFSFDLIIILLCYIFLSKKIKV